MASLAPDLPKDHDSTQANEIAISVEQICAELLSAVGQGEINQYETLVSQFGFPVQLVARIRKEFAESMPGRVTGVEQLKQELARLLELIPRLGRSKDIWLANRYGLSAVTVRNLRLRVGITEFDFSGQVPLEELGNTADDELAETYGVPERFVYAMRRELGIPKAGSRSALYASIAEGKQGLKSKFNSFDLLAHDKPELVKRLGTTHDRQLASEHGVTPALVYGLRKHLGIDRFSRIAQLVSEMPELVARLGADTDRQLAREFGVADDIPRRMRDFLKKDSERRKRRDYRDVSPTIVEMLKSSSATSLAFHLDLNRREVHRIRDEQNIPAFSKRVAIPDEAIKALGTASDSAIAKQFGITRNVVTRRRVSLGITAYSDTGRAVSDTTDAAGIDADPVTAQAGDLPREKPLGKGEIPAELVELLGKMPDSVLARNWGVSGSTIARHRRARGIPLQPTKSVPSSLPDEAVPQLGKRPDADIALEFGVSDHVVYRARKSRGIARYVLQNDFPAEALPALGKATDKAIARQFGLTENHVRDVRTKRGIQAFSASPTNR